RRGEEPLSGLEIRDDVTYRIDADVGLLEVQVVLGVIRDILPHPVRFEVVVSPEERRFAPDALRLGGGRIQGSLGDYLVQQSQRGISARHAFVSLAPLLVEIILHVTNAPEVGLDLEDRLLVAGLRSFVGVAARDAAPHPVAGRAAPRSRGAGAAIE